MLSKRAVVQTYVCAKSGEGCGREVASRGARRGFVVHAEVLAPGGVDPLAPSPSAKLTSAAEGRALGSHRLPLRLCLAANAGNCCASNQHVTPREDSFTWFLFHLFQIQTTPGIMQCLLTQAQCATQQALFSPIAPYPHQPCLLIIPCHVG